MRELKKLGFSGAPAVEREISGLQRIDDIGAGKRFLQRMLVELS